MLNRINALSLLHGFMCGWEYNGDDWDLSGLDCLSVDDCGQFGAFFGCNRAYIEEYGVSMN